MPTYNGPVISVTFTTLPNLKPRLLPTRNRWLLSRFLGARARRDFEIAADWVIEITSQGIPSPLAPLCGVIVIPASTIATYDGASVPLPWTVTFLSLGTLRPLGVLLTASIVHDYAFRYGGLVYITAVPQSF